MDVSEMTQEQLDELKEAVMLRERELRIARGAEVLEKLKIGTKVKYQDAEWKVIGLDEEYCTITPTAGEGRKKKIFFEDIEEVIKEKK